MRIGGLQKISFVDYPGVIAATVFTLGCNFKCGYCHNPELAQGIGRILNNHEIFKYLEMARHKRIDGVCICGGEPTLQNDIETFCQTVKNLGLKIKLDTNGSNPEVLKKCKVDFIAMDVKTSMDKYRQITSLKKIPDLIQESIEWVKKNYLVSYEFRTTLVPNLVSIDDIHEIGKLIKGAKNWALQTFRPQKTWDPFFEKIKPYEKLYQEELLSVARQYCQTVRLI